MNLRFLGTNGWYDTSTGNTVCVLIQTGNEHIILDAGNGFYKIDQYIKDKKPIYLFLSHYHLDHVIGLHTLGKFNFRQGIDVYGPSGLNELFRRVINIPYTIPINHLNTAVRLHEINKVRILPAGIGYKPLKHSVECYGYRILSAGKIATYCTDTGLCRNLSLLARGADIFITECSFKGGQENKKWPHLNPTSAARVARDAKAKRLMLIHFDASIYLTFRERKIAQSQAKMIFKHTVAAKDGSEIVL